METAVLILRLSVLCFVVGAVAFGYYLRTRNRWAWTIAVVLWIFGGLGVSLWF